MLSGLGAHEFYILVDDTNKVVGQLNGFAVGSDNVPAVTNISGQLQVRTDYASPLDADTKYIAVAIGPADSIMKMWDAGKACGDAINQKQISYNLLDTFGGHNSNAAYSTIGACMNVSDPDLTGSLTLVPGLHDIILDANTIKEIQRQHGITPPSSTGGGGSGTSGGGELSGTPGGSPIGGSTYDPPSTGGGTGGGYWKPVPIAAHSIYETPPDPVDSLHAGPIVLVGVTYAVI